jgi:putative endonuclease
MKLYFVYIMASKTRRLYTGVTNDLQKRVYEHKNKMVEGFSFRYNINRLVYYEESRDINAAIAREKQIKGWLRNKKLALVDSANPQWSDLTRDWFEPRDSSLRSE